MAITVYPVTSTAAGTNLTATVMSAAAANTAYSGTVSLVPGVYTITCTSTVTTYMDFFNGSTGITTAGATYTTSGTVTINLATAATKIVFWTTSGTNTTITLTETGSPVTTAASGTLDTLTTSQTYTQSGAAYVIVCLLYTSDAADE